jgi:hypothetical protein
MNEEFGWAYWEDADLIWTSSEGARVFAKDEWLCYCPPETNPGDADSIVRPYRPGMFGL